MFNRKIRKEVVYIANGRLEGETVRALLESFGIPAFLNQESAGSTYGLTIGLLGEAEVLVPLSKIEEAKKIIKDMKDGKFDN